MIKSILPEYDVRPWDLANSRNFWQDKNNQVKFLEYVKEKENIKKMEDWYMVLIQNSLKLTEVIILLQVTSDTLRHHGGRGLVSLYGESPAKVIGEVLTDYNWNIWKFKKLPNSTVNLLMKGIPITLITLTNS